MSGVRLAGGCQCGAVRFAVHSQPERPCVCHCRMCQKAAGNVFGTFAGVAASDVELTRGGITWWVSSSGGERGFCRNCGTPLAWRNPEHTWISMTIGAFDEPERVKPVYAYGAEGMVPWLDEMMSLVPTPTGSATPQAKPAGDPHYQRIRATNHQHPDHDTVDWTPHPSST